MKKKQGFTLRQIGTEQVLVAESIEIIDFTKIISFNATAAFLWNEIGDDEFTEERLVELLMNNYDVSRELVVTDVSNLVKDWIREGIVIE